jgi:hypothetical protein
MLVSESIWNAFETTIRVNHDTEEETPMTARSYTE